MVGSLSFHAWLNWVWYKKVGSQYEDFSNHSFASIGLGVRFAFYLSTMLLILEIPSWTHLDGVISYLEYFSGPFGMVDHQTIERGHAA